MDELEKILFVPFLEDELRALFAGEGAEFVAGVFGSDGLLQFAFDGEVEPFLRARFEFEAHASGHAQRTDEANGLIGEAVNDQGANFAVFDVREAVGGIEKQAAGCGIQRDSDGVEREVAAAQVFHDGRPANFGARAGSHVIFVASGGKAALDFSGEKYFDVAQLFVLGEDFGSALFEFAGNFGRIAFDGEIEIAKGCAGDEVADGAPGEIKIEAHGGGQFLDAEHGGTLLRREAAFEQKHIIRHCAPSTLGRAAEAAAPVPTLVPFPLAKRAGDAAL